jgi:hypothetical protein
MDRHALVEKLQSLLNDGIDSEPAVVYFLVEIRKLLEIREAKLKYEGLTFHCEWALHSRMEYSMAKRLLKRVDELQEAINGRIELSQDAVKEIGELISAERFKRELEGFLASESLPCGICAPPAWARFVTNYAKVISDCPLQAKAQARQAPHRPQIELIYVKSLVLEAITPADEDPDKGLSILWRVDFKNEPEAKAIARFRFTFLGAI